MTRPEHKRSWMLTLFAVFLMLLGLEDIIKPFLGSSTAAVSGARVRGSFVFFGMRLEGSWMYLGWLLAAFLFILAIGIWRMGRYASVMADCYAAYVLLNVAIYAIFHPLPGTSADRIFALLYESIAVAGSWILAILLRRERAHLT